MAHYNPNSLLFANPKLLIPGASPIGRATIDWEHGLTDRLTYAWVASQRKELCKNLVLDVRNGAAATYEEVASYTFDGVDDIIEVVGAVHNHTQGDDFSGVLRLKGIANGTLIARRAQAGGTGVDWEIQIFSSKPALRVGDDVYTFSSASSFTGTDWLTLGFSHTDADTDCFVNGALDQNTSNITGTNNDASTNMSIGARYATYPTPSNMYTGQIEFAYIWYNRKLTAAEQLSLYRDPYQILTVV